LRWKHSGRFLLVRLQCDQYLIILAGKSKDRPFRHIEHQPNLIGMMSYSDLFEQVMVGAHH